MIFETLMVCVAVCWIVGEVLEQRRRETKTGEFKENDE